MLGRGLKLGETEQEIIAVHKDGGIKLIYMQIQCIGELVLMGRNSTCFCGSGRKVKHCHPDVNEKSLVAQLLRLYALIDERNAYGVSSPCQKGCAYCCTADFPVYLSEFLVILDYLDIGNMYYRYRRWMKSFIEQDPVVEGMCLFLHEEDNTCRIYAVRPLICRNYGITQMATESPCHIISDVTALLDESLYHYDIDVIANRIKITGTYGEIMPYPRPLTLWVKENVNEDGLLKTEQVRNLLLAAVNFNIDEFIHYYHIW